MSRTKKTIRFKPKKKSSFTWNIEKYTSKRYKRIKNARIGKKLGRNVRLTTALLKKNRLTLRERKQLKKDLDELNVKHLDNRTPQESTKGKPLSKYSSFFSKSAQTYFRASSKVSEKTNQLTDQVIGESTRFEEEATKKVYSLRKKSMAFLSNVVRPPAQKKDAKSIFRRMRLKNMLVDFYRKKMGEENSDAAAGAMAFSVFGTTVTTAVGVLMSIINMVISIAIMLVTTIIGILAPFIALIIGLVIFLVIVLSAWFATQSSLTDVYLMTQIEQSYVERECNYNLQHNDTEKLTHDPHELLAIFPTINAPYTDKERVDAILNKVFEYHVKEKKFPDAAKKYIAYAYGYDDLSESNTTALDAVMKTYWEHVDNHNGVTISLTPFADGRDWTTGILKMFGYHIQNGKVENSISMTLKAVEGEDIQAMTPKSSVYIKNDTIYIGSSAGYIIQLKNVVPTKKILVDSIDITAERKEFKAEDVIGTAAKDEIEMTIIFLKSDHFVDPFIVLNQGQSGGINRPHINDDYKDLPFYGEARFKPKEMKRLNYCAKEKLGLDYVFGAEGPNTYDCSGFVWKVLVESRLYPSLERCSAQVYYNMSIKIPFSEAKAGDLLFFSTASYAYITHIAIYLGNNKMIHAVYPEITIADITPFWLEAMEACGYIPR